MFEIKKETMSITDKNLEKKNLKLVIILTISILRMASLEAYFL